MLHLLLGLQNIDGRALKLVSTAPGRPQTSLGRSAAAAGQVNGSLIRPYQPARLHSMKQQLAPQVACTDVQLELSVLPKVHVGLLQQLCKQVEGKLKSP